MRSKCQSRNRDGDDQERSDRKHRVIGKRCTQAWDPVSAPVRDRLLKQAPKIRPVQQESEPIETRWKAPGFAPSSRESGLFQPPEKKALPASGSQANRKRIRQNSSSKALPASARCAVLAFRSRDRWGPALAAVAAQPATRQALLRRRERDSIGRLWIGPKVPLAKKQKC